MRLRHSICVNSYQRIFTKNIYIVGFFFTKNTISIAAATSSSSTQVNMYSMSPFEKFSKDPIPPNPCLRKPSELCCSVAEKWVELIFCKTVFIFWNSEIEKWSVETWKVLREANRSPPTQCFKICRILENCVSSLKEKWRKTDIDSEARNLYLGSSDSERWNSSLLFFQISWIDVKIFEVFLYGRPGPTNFDVFFYFFKTGLEK